MPRLVLASLLFLLLLPAAAIGAGPARTCDEPRPGGALPRATPAEARMDKDTLDRGLHALQDRRSYAVRILRHGCLVSEDTNRAANGGAQYEGWELTSGVVSMLAGRAMELGLLDPADPVGALVPEADAAHGALRIGDLLARSAGLEPEPDDLTLRDRLRRALLRPIGSPRFGDAPTGGSLVVAALQAATRQELQAFAQRELFGPLGLPSGSWRWTRDATGLTHATFGLSMTGDAWVRIGELLRREGVWSGRRLLSAEWMARATGRTTHNPCFGWSVWSNREPSCSGTPHRLVGGPPADLQQLRGRFDQRVSVLPALGITIVRLGTTAADTRAPDDAFTWERGILMAIAGAVRDVEPGRTRPEPGVLTDDPYREDALGAFAEPPPLPPAGPPRARPVAVDGVAQLRGKRRTTARVVLRCPAVGARSCAGSATLDGAVGPRAFELAPGAAAPLVFRVRRGAGGTRTVRAEVRDAVGTSESVREVALRR